MKGQPPGKRQGGCAKEALDKIIQLFSIERGLVKCTPEQRLKVRQRKSRPIVENLHRWLYDIKGEILPKSVRLSDQYF